MEDDGLAKNKDWDGELINIGGHFLQSEPWAAFQRALGRSDQRDTGKGWAWQAFERRSRGIYYLLSPYGPIIKDDAKVAISSLIGRGRKLGCDFIRLEPCGMVTDAILHSLGGCHIAEVEPETTLILDLSRDEQDLRTDLSSGHRNEINGTERRGIKIGITDKATDIEEFLAMLHETATRAHVRFYPDDYYRKMLEVLQPLGVAKLYMAKVEGKPVAAAIFYDFNDIRYYAHAGAYQDLNRQAKASVSLVWQAIIDAKAEGKKYFDLWGIAPTDDSHHAWAGITKFKKGFGGRIVTTIGTWDIPIKPLKYKTYQMYRKVRGRE